MDTLMKTLPAVPLRGLTVMPGMMIHFDAASPASIAALEQAMEGDQLVFLVTQKNIKEQNPKLEDLYTVGTIAQVKQMAKLPGKTMRVLAEGLTRAELLSISATEPCMMMEVIELEEEDLDLDEETREAMIRILKEKLQEYGEQNLKFAKEVLPGLLNCLTLEELMEGIGSQMVWDYQVRQRILECDDIEERYEVVLRALMAEIEIFRIKRDFQQKVKEDIDQNQKEYILREQMKVIRRELGEDNTLSDADEYYKKVEELCADEETKARLKKEIDRFQSMPSGSQEANVIRTYIETLLELPWKKVSEDNNDLKHAEEVLNADHYGLEKVKERVLEYLAVRSLTKKPGGTILCLVGPPGTGKTSIARSVARALNKKYVRISLGGVRDEAEIRGHRKTYVGAMPGRLVDGLRQAGVSNPLMLLDEIDKVSSDYKGDTSSALLEVLDAEQNGKFRDHYVELPIDLSQVLFIATANTTQTIPGPLLDRMELIEVNSYTENEKFHIAKDYLVKKQIEKNGLTKEQITISDKALEQIVRNYTREAGVRNLERRIGDICRKAAREFLENDRKSIRVKEKNLEKYLGKKRVNFDKANETDEIGIVRGLAWTSVGGDTLEIEVNVMPGKGTLLLTGQMGDVMKESAQTALTFVRSIGPDAGVSDDYFEKHDLHIHIPEGAVPKDGPSAGITMATAMFSAVTNRKVLAKVAMTGEITLRGRVLPIGGLKEKILAAKMAGIEKVLVPEKNRPDIAELSKEITKGLQIVYVREMSQVLEEALAKEGEKA